MKSIRAAFLPLLLAAALPAQTRMPDLPALDGSAVDRAADLLWINDTSEGANPTASKNISIAELWESLGGADVSATELGYLDGVSSAIQTQLDSKAGLGSVTDFHLPYVNAGVLEDSGISAPSVVTTSSGIQSIADAKTFTGDITFGGAVAIPDGALAIADTSGLQTALDGKQDTATAVLFSSAQSLSDAQKEQVAANVGTSSGHIDFEQLLRTDVSGGARAKKLVAMSSPFNGSVMISDAGIEVYTGLADDPINLLFDAATSTRNVTFRNTSGSVSVCSSGAGAPGSTPVSVGLFYVNTTSGVIYTSVGTASPAGWVPFADTSGNVIGWNADQGKYQKITIRGVAGSEHTEISDL